jgi:hypothetical protein
LHLKKKRKKITLGIIAVQTHKIKKFAMVMDAITYPLSRIQRPPAKMTVRAYNKPARKYNQEGFWNTSLKTIIGLIIVESKPWQIVPINTPGSPIFRTRTIETTRFTTVCRIATYASC